MATEANHGTEHSRLRARVKALVERNGGVVIAGAASGFGRPGVPDLVCCVAGRSVNLEIKTGSGRLTEPQQRMAEQIEQAGGLFAVVRDIDDAIAALETIVGDVVMRRNRNAK